MGADPPHRASLESAAGRATETVPTSECRRRPEGTSSRTSVAARTSGSARREARGAFTFEARAETYAPDLGGRTPDPDTLPSYRVPRARGPGTSRVPEPAPLRVRSRRGLRVRSGPVRVSVVRRHFDGPRTVVARSRRCPAHQPRCKRFLRARSRVSEMRLVAPAGVATGDASDRLLHSETVPTRALVLRRFPAQQPSPCDAFRRIARGLLSSQSLAAPCPSTRTSLFARRSARPEDSVKRAPGSSGPPDANEAGENRASRRGPHFGAGRLSRGGVFFRRVKIEIPVASDTLVASSLPLCGRFFRPRTRARRPPRPVPRGPRERRAHRRSRVPSADGRDAHLARAEARTKPRCLHRRRGAHVMRIAELR